MHAVIVNTFPDQIIQTEERYQIFRYRSLAKLLNTLCSTLSPIKLSFLFSFLFSTFSFLGHICNDKQCCLIVLTEIMGMFFICAMQ